MDPEREDNRAVAGFLRFFPQLEFLEIRWQPCADGFEAFSEALPLHTIAFEGLICRRQDLEQFLRNCKDTLMDISLQSVFLESDTWMYLCDMICCELKVTRFAVRNCGVVRPDGDSEFVTEVGGRRFTEFMMLFERDADGHVYTKISEI